MVETEQTCGMTKTEGRKMTAIEFFSRLEASERSISTATRKVEVLKSMAEKITSTLEGEVVSHTRNVHSFEDSILRLAEAKEELALASKKYSLLVDFIMAKMSLLENPDEELLLSYHHLSHIPLSVAAEKLHHSRSWGFSQHDIALRNLDIILAELREEDIPLGA